VLIRTFLKETNRQKLNLNNKLSDIKFIFDIATINEKVLFENIVGYFVNTTVSMTTKQN